MKIKFFAFIILVCCCGCSSANKHKVQNSNDFAKDFTGNITMIFTNNISGKMEPCGCSGIKNGGLARLGTYLKELRDERGGILLVDGGDLLGKRVFPGKIKTFFEIMNILNYTCLAPGEEELPYLQDIYKYSKTPVVVRNYKDGKKHKSFFSKVLTDGWGKKIKVRIWGAVTPRFADENSKASILPMDKAAFSLPPKKKRGVDIFNILLLHGSLSDARSIARMRLGYNIIIAAHEGPSLGAPIIINDTYILRVDPQGVYVGRASISINAGILRDVEVDVETVSGELKEDEIVQKKIVAYRASLKRTGALSYFAEKKSVKGGLQFIGVKKCGECHPKNLDAWEKTKHYTAFSSLQDVGQSYNPDCVMCHSVGYGFISGFTGENKTPEFINVQCENCHGAGSAHAAAPKENRLTTPKEELCLGCHTDERDTHFIFEEYLPRIGCGEGGGEEHLE